MPIERYYLDKPIILHATRLLKGPEFHHLARVMRSRIGDRLELVNGQGVLAQGIIENLSKEEATVRIEEIIMEEPNPTRIILAQALPKLNRLDFILEKGTELGVDEFWLFPGHLSLKKEFSENQHERARTITIAAMKQSGRLTLPKVSILPALEKWLALEGTGFFGDLDAEAPLLLNILKQEPPNSSIFIFIGPESGWSENEIKLLKNKGVKGVRLHKNILRTDTASLVALSLIQHHRLFL